MNRDRHMTRYGGERSAAVYQREEEASSRHRGLRSTDTQQRGIESSSRHEGVSPPTTNNKGDEDEDIIHIPGFDYSDLVEKYKNSLVGRMFHPEGRSIDSLITFMPKARIWDVEGRVQGINLGNGKFQFDFKEEADVVKVLAKRPCHFNQWSFSLERWEPNIRDDFPNTMLFWIKVTGVPTHYRKTETYQGIGDALGEVKMVDTDGERIQVSLNGDKPLQFERRVGFDNGDVVKVSLRYDGLYRYCFTCRKISHEERSCPELTEAEKERNMKLRAESTASFEIAHRDLIPRKRAASEDRSYQKPPVKRRIEDYIPPHEENRPRDLRDDIQYKRESRSKDIWNRLDDTRKSAYPRHRERYQPYDTKQRYQRRNHYEDSLTASSRDYRYLRDNATTRRESYRDDRGYGPSRLNSTLGSDSQRTVSEPLRFDRTISARKEYPDSRLKKHYQPRLEEPRRWTGKEYEQKNESGAHGRLQWRVKSTKDITPSAQLGGVGQTVNGVLTNPFPTQLDSNKQSLKEKNDLGGAHSTPNPQKESLVVPTEEEAYNAYEEDLDEDAMNEEMVDNDDLLEEEFVDDIHMTDQDQEQYQEQDQEQIEALSQLPPSPPIRSIQKAQEANVKEATKISKIPRHPKGKKAAGLVPPLNSEEAGAKKKPTKTPDIKGVASRKMNVLRTCQSPSKRSSPKSSPIKRQTTGRSKTTSVPRNEVFPSALSKKAAAKPGSVGSQKPPSTHI